MDLHPITTFVRVHWLEVGGLFTLAVSLWIAFGPLRHRLPRVLTRFGKYSATLKLLTLSGLCWYTLYHFLTDDKPSAALNWMLGCLGLMLLGGAVFIFTRKPTHAPHRHDSLPAQAKPAQAKGPPVKPAAPARSSPSVSGQ